MLLNKFRSRVSKIFPPHCTHFLKTRMRFRPSSKVMDLFKAILNKIAALKSSSDAIDEDGDHYVITKQGVRLEGHPSKDNFGHPIYTTYEYVQKRCQGLVGVTQKDKEELEEQQIDDDDPALELQPDFDVNLSSEEDCPAPTFFVLRKVLPYFIHPMLVADYKKDCRVWLWKGERGRLARASVQWQLQAREDAGEDRRSLCFRYVVNV